MKVSKVFGCVLGLHFGVISILLVQPGCQTSQPPTQTYTQGRTAPADRSTTPSLPGGSIPATRVVDQNESRRTVRSDTVMRPVVPGSARTNRNLYEATREGEEGSSGLDSAFNAGFDDGDFGDIDDVAPITPLNRQSGSGQSGQSIEVVGESFETYTVKRGDNLWTIAKRNNVSLNELYAANGLDKNSILRVGQEIQIPVESGTASVNTVTADSYQPTSLAQGSTTYTVKRGDTLSKIANQYGTTVNAIKGANEKNSDMIRVGENLVIPVSGSSSGNAGNTSGSSSTRASASSGSGASSTPTRSTNTSGSRTHTVKAGQFPATIARQYGMTTGELLALNGITDPRKLQVGQELRVSGSGSARNVDSRTETLGSRSADAVPSNTDSRSSSASTSSQGPVEIQVIEADPMIEGDFSDVEADAMFEGAVEIPVIRMEE
jgi:LysM repeat protein